MLLACNKTLGLGVLGNFHTQKDGALDVVLLVFYSRFTQYTIYPNFAGYHKK
jgi:hypothetical protein